MRKLRSSHAVRFAAGAVIDTLESRRLLSTVSVSPNGDGTNTLNAIGTNGNDNLYIFDDATNNFVEVVDDKNHDGIADASEVFLFDQSANITIFHVDTKKGNDKVEFHGLTDYDHKDRSISVDLGDGNDSFLFTTDPARDVPLGLDADSLGGDIQDGSDFNFDIHGDANKDTITLDLTRTSIRGSEVSAQIDASGGDDIVNVNLPDSEQGESIGFSGLAVGQVVDGGTENLASVLQIDIDLGGGNDTLNQHVNTVVFNDSFVTINVLGQSGKDKYNDYENFSLNNGSTFTVNADLGSGDDRYHGEFSFASLTPTIAEGDAVTPFSGGGINVDQSSSANFILHGADGNDKLEVDHIDEPIVVGGLPVSNSAIRGMFNVQLYGGDGNDLAEIDLDPGPFVHVGITGIFRGLVSGDRGNDHLRLDIVAGGEGGNYDLSELGGIGNDILGAAFQDASTLGVHYGPRGGILVDGGTGTDKYDTEGNGIFKLRSVEVFDDTLEPPFV